MEFSPFDPRLWDDPYPAYRALRAEETLYFLAGGAGLLRHPLRRGRGGRHEAGALPLPGRLQPPLWAALEGLGFADTKEVRTYLLDRLKTERDAGLP